MASKEVREPYQWYTAANNSQSSSQGQGEVTLVPTPRGYNVAPFKYRRERGVTYYELSNHLGNPEKSGQVVLVTVTDMIPNYR